MPKRIGTLALLAGSSVVAVGLSLLLDRALGRVLLSAPEESGLIYPPNTSVEYRTPEFHWTAHINELGYRGAPLSSITPGRRTRVVAIGDSSTYGWGVDDGAVWTSLLAGELGANGTEVANLGWVGRGPADYADVAQRVIPTLTPDLVVVGVLQGDDLQQLGTWQGAADAEPPPAPDAVRNLLRRAYPGLFELRRRHQKHISAGALRTFWQRTARGMLERLTPDEGERFRRLEPKVRRWFRDGDLNPHLVNLGVRRPRYFLDPLALDDHRTRAAIDLLARELARIGEVASAHGADTVVAAVPYSLYVSPLVRQRHQELGFETGPSMLTSDAPDDAVEQAAARAGLKFCSVLEAFRRQPGVFFFEWDGHLTAAGNELFAATLAECLRSD